MLKKILCTLLVLCMMLAMFAGCQQTPQVKDPDPDTGKDVPNPDDKTPEKKDYTLKVWTFQTFSAETDQRVIDQIQKFSQESGVNVVVETVPETTFTSKFTASLEAGALPDVTAMRCDHINITYPNVPFLDLTEIYKEIEEDTGRKFIDNYIDSMTTDNKVYGLPFFTSGQPGIYRTDIYTNGVPDTWDGICEEALRVSKASEGMYGLGIGCGPTDNDGETALRMWIWAEGGRLFDEAGKPDPVNEGTIKVVQKYVDLYKAGAVPEAATTWDAGGNNNSFLLEESALHYNPFTVVNAMKANEGYSDLLANTGAVGLPKGSNGRWVFLNPGGFAINAKSEHPEDAQALLTALCEKEWYNEFISLSAPLNPPVFEDAIELELWKNDPYCKTMVELVTEADGVGWFGYPCKEVEGKKAGALVFNNYLLCKAITRIITEDLEVEAGLELLKQDMESLLSN